MARQLQKCINGPIDGKRRHSSGGGRAIGGATGFPALRTPSPTSPTPTSPQITASVLTCFLLCEAWEVRASRIGRPTRVFFALLIIRETARMPPPPETPGEIQTPASPYCHHIEYEPRSTEARSFFQRVQDVPEAPPQMRPGVPGLQSVSSGGAGMRGLRAGAAMAHEQREPPG